MTVKGIRLLVASVALLFASNAYISGQQVTISPETLRVIVYDGDMAALLAHLANSYSNVTIGLEVDPRQPRSRINIRVNDGTLDDIMTAIMQSASNYQWHREGSFIEVYPKESPSALLDVTINSFQFSGNSADAMRALLSLPEVQSQMVAMNLRRREAAETSQVKDSNQFYLEVKDVTLRRALHEIASKSGSRFWAFQSYGPRQFSISNSYR